MAVHVGAGQDDLVHLVQIAILRGLIERAIERTGAARVPVTLLLTGNRVGRFDLPRGVHRGDSAQWRDGQHHEAGGADRPGDETKSGAAAPLPIIEQRRHAR
jgi:hypothetical protein